MVVQAQKDGLAAADTVPHLLRPPPFPGLDDLPQAADPAPILSPVTGAARRELFRTLARARVGGNFWAPGYVAAGSNPETVIRVRTKAEKDAIEHEFAGTNTLFVARDPALGGCDAGPDTDPWSILPNAQRLLAHGDDEWVALARVLGLPVHVLSVGPFGKPVDSDSTLDECAARALCQPMRDPFDEGWLDPEAAIALLAEWRRVIDANRGKTGQTIVAACGMSWWKREEIRRFLWTPENKLRIFNSAWRALSHAQRRGGALAVWPSRLSPKLVAQAATRGVPLVRVEDGFVRSAGLGSDLVPPSSVVVDRQGIHFDPSGPSDLETILKDTEFAPPLLARARKLREAVVKARISKYARGHATQAGPERSAPERRIVLVPGQVENDMSVLAGGGGLTSNRELLCRVRELEPDAEIWWRPHPDVDAGHRVGAVEDEVALQFADRIVRQGSMGDLLDQVDGLHVLTSLSGFEALLRQRDVTCHGTPFYAGWGLTRDLGDMPERRGRHLSLDELVAGVLLLYPRYLDPVTGLPCTPEMLIQRMTEDNMPNRQSWIGPVRRWQGRLASRLRKTGRAKTDG